MTSKEPSATCPLHASRDDRKSAAIAAQYAQPDKGAQRITSFTFAREILRSSAMKQGGAGADQVVIDDPSHAPVFFLDGEDHRRKRNAIARFFTPKAIATRHRAVMENTTDALLAELRQTGRAQLDWISFRLAVAVAAEIIGLTNSDQAAMAGRIQKLLAVTVIHRLSPLRRLWASVLQRYRALNFFYRDVRPAIKARRIEKKDDVISHLISEGYSNPAILIECMTYASAGMVTTREFIVMVAWHLFGNDALRERFLAGDEDDQFVILEEILRLEPVAAILHRIAAEDIETSEAGPIAEGAFFAIDIRAVNTDETVVGACPYALDPDRAARMKVTGAFLSFGDGSHRCPGSQVALHETRVFLDRLMRIPGIRLERAPDMSWNDALMSYELRNAIVACDRA